MALLLLLFLAFIALPGLWAVPLRVNEAACIQRTAFPFVGITDALKAVTALGKLHLSFSPQVLFALLHESHRAPHPRGGTS